MTKIVGIGLPKTGTKSLGEALKRLGYRVRSADLSLTEAAAFGMDISLPGRVEGYDAFEDIPWSLLYQEIDALCPGSRFVFTYRRPETWLRSYRAMMARDDSPAARHLRSFIFGHPAPMLTDRIMLARYYRHWEDVCSYFADRRDALIYLPLESPDKWRCLCEFLGHDVPDAPWPHLNPTNYPDE